MEPIQHAASNYLPIFLIALLAAVMSLVVPFLIERHHPRGT